MLVDANLLIYAVNEDAPEHQPAATWLEEQLNGRRRVALPWQSLGAFLRIITHPRGFARPLRPDLAWERVSDWLEAPATWVPEPGHQYSRVLGELVAAYGAAGNLVPDAMLAALAIEHGLTLFSNDSDFAQFSGLRWENPLA